MNALEITTKIGCSVGCNYCPQKSLVTNYNSDIKELSLENFIKMINKLDTRVNIHFTGYSEPFLNKSCMDMIEYAYNKGHKVKVNTTLMGISVEDAKRLVKIPLIGFMLHLPADEKIENITVDERYLTVLKIIQDNPPCKINSVYHGKKLHRELVEYFKTTYRGKIHHRAGNIDIDDMSIQSDLYLTDNYTQKLKGKLSCHRIYQNVLLPNGDVTLCCMDYSQKHILGNLMNNSVEELYQGESFQKVISGLNDESIDILCRDCTWYAKNVDFKAKYHNFFLPKVKELFDGKLIVKRRIKEDRG